MACSTVIGEELGGTVGASVFAARFADGVLELDRRAFTKATRLSGSMVGRGVASRFGAVIRDGLNTPPGNRCPLGQKRFHDRIAQVGGRRRTPQVWSQGSAFTHGPCDSGFESLGRVGEPQVPEPQGATPYRANRIGAVPTGAIR